MHENEKYFNEQIFQCGLQKMDSVISEVLDNYVERCETDAGTGGITSGFKELDDCTDGWMPGDMIILASFAGIGLTSLALNLQSTPTMPTIFQSCTSQWARAQSKSRSVY